MHKQTIVAVAFYFAAAQDRPLAPPRPQQVTCSDGNVVGSVSVSCRVDAATTDEVDFGLARADDVQNWMSVHYVVDVVDGMAEAVIPGLSAGVQYKVFARTHHRDSSEGWNEKWSAVSAGKSVCVAATEANSSTASAPIESSKGGSSELSTTWIEVFRYRGPGYSGQPAITDYNLPDFLDNHDSGDANKQLSRWDFSGTGSPDNDVVSYTRYCVEVLDVELTTSVHAVGIGGPTTTSQFSNYLSCNAGKCHCPNHFDAFTLEGEIQTPRAWVDSSCPTGQSNCNCEASQLALSANYTGRWAFSPPFTNDAYMGADGSPACGWAESQYPCHPDASPKGYWFHHPELTRCKAGANIGDNGCTWRRSPLIHTLSVRQLLNARSIGGGSPTYHKMSIEEELVSTQMGKQAFAMVGATTCGHNASPAPSPTPPTLDVWI